MPRLRERGLGTDSVGPHVPIDRYRRVERGRDPGRGDAAPLRPGGGDLRPARGRRRSGECQRDGRGRHHRRRPRRGSRGSIVRERLGDHIWAEGETTWADAVGERLTGLGWRLAVEEIGTGGQLVGALRRRPMARPRAHATWSRPARPTTTRTRADSSRVRRSFATRPASTSVWPFASARGERVRGERRHRDPRPRSAGRRAPPTSAGRWVGARQR